MAATAENVMGGRRGESRGQSVNNSCLGLEGERALFESLSAGAEGAFVAWVKGGHETRQECKRLVTDVLELLTAPKGQPGAFFRRGVQVKLASGGRVGIAAKASKAKTNLSEMNEEEGFSNGRDAIIPIARETVSKTGGENASDSVAEGAAKHHDDEQMVGSNRQLVDGMRQKASGNGQWGRINAFNNGITEKDGGGELVHDRELVQEQTSGPKYGYASLRKIRDREPLPTVRLFSV